MTLGILMEDTLENIKSKKREAHNAKSRRDARVRAGWKEGDLDLPPHGMSIKARLTPIAKDAGVHYKTIEKRIKAGLIGEALLAKKPISQPALIMEALANGLECTREIAEAVGIKSSSCSAILSVLAKDGVIERCGKFYHECKGRYSIRYRLPLRGNNRLART